MWTRALLGADCRRNLLLPGENLPTQEESNPQENWETGNTRSRSQRLAPPTTPWLLPSHPPDHLLCQPEAPSGENAHPVGYVSQKLMKHHLFLGRFSFLSALFCIFPHVRDTSGRPVGRRVQSTAVLAGRKTATDKPPSFYLCCSMEPLLI